MKKRAKMGEKERTDLGMCGIMQLTQYGISGDRGGSERETGCSL